MEKQNSTKSDRRGGKGRDDRDKAPREIIEISNDEMSDKLQKNFETYIEIEKFNFNVLNDKE